MEKLYKEMRELNIKIDTKQHKYICPYCGADNYIHPHYETWYPPNKSFSRYPQDDTERNAGRTSYNLCCSNESCRKPMFVSISNFSSQIEIKLYGSYIKYPDYIPAQIRADYEEASQIMDISPKAAATLFRRCLQGMIRDFWGIKKDRLCDEIAALKGVVADKQWESIDALRKIGNIGAHMEKDVDRIVDISFEEAVKLKSFVEFLLGQWYVNRQREDQFNSDLTAISSDKQEKRNG